MSNIDIPPPPADWSVRNGAFIGYCLATRDAAEEGCTRMGLRKKHEHGWDPFSQDLRCIDGLKQYDQDNPGITDLYHSNTLVGSVNVAMHVLLPHWLSVRHAYDRMPTTDEAMRTKEVTRIQKEGRP